MRTTNVQIFSGTVNADGDSYATPIDVRQSEETILFLDVESASGVNPSLVVSLMTQDPLGGKWYLVGNFDAATGPSQDITYIINGLGSNLACAWTVTGEFTFTLNASLKD